MLITALVVAGAASYLQLGVDRFPKLDLPTVFVRTSYPGSAPQEVESEVTQVIEDAVATVAGIDEMRSISRESASFVIITFDIDRDLDSGAQDVRDAIDSVLNRLPPNIAPPVVGKRDTDTSPVVTLAVSGPRDMRELYVLADRYVKNVIESAQGVGEASISGAADRAVRVEIDARRLAAYGLSIVQIREAMARQNTELPGGRVDTGIRELGLRTLGRLDHSRDFADLVVATVDGHAVRIRDLGEVIDGTKEVRTISRLDGQPAVVVQVQRQSGTNTVEVIDAIKDRLPRCRKLLPDDVGVTILQDQSRYIKASLHEVQRHLITGSILASIVVLLFMRSWRPTVIAAIAIPASIISSFMVMRALDFTLNNVTMLALVLMVGVVIDDSIVVLENIFRFIEEKGMSPMQAAVLGTREIGLAVLATTMSLVIVFLPVSFMSSVTGRMLFEFGITATVAILVSMLISFSLTPMMCSRLLRPSHADGDKPTSRRGFYHWIEFGYLRCLRAAMRRRPAVLLVVVLMVAANVPMYRLIKQDYIPTNVDESEFEVRVEAMEGVTLQSMTATMDAVEAELREIDGIEMMLTEVGSRSGRVNRGEIYVRLTDIDDRTFSLWRLIRETMAGYPGAAFAGNFTQREIMTEIRRRTSTLPGASDDGDRKKTLRIGVRNQTSLRQGAPVDLDFAIFGPELNKLEEYGNNLREKVKDVPGIVDTYTTLRSEKPELHVHIDRERAAAMGVDVREIAETLRIAVGGDDRVSRYLDKRLDDAYDVELRLTGIDRSSRESISQLYVRGHGAAALDGGGASDPFLFASADRPTPVRLDNLVTFTAQRSAARVDRLNRQRMVAVRANIEGGYSLGESIDAMREASQQIGLTNAYDTSVRGRGRELERTFKDLRWAFVLSFIFMYIVLAAQFEHLTHPLTILISLPIAVPFGLLSLWLGGETLNLYSALGILVLFGVVKKASILQVDHMNQLRAAGMERLPAIIQANRDRLRPILMTTISFVAGMTPLLLGIGPGAEERRSIAVLAVGGQSFSLFLTLLAVPVVYSYLDDLALLFRRRRPTDSAAAESGGGALAPALPGGNGEPETTTVRATK